PPPRPPQASAPPPRAPAPRPPRAPSPPGRAPGGRAPPPGTTARTCARRSRPAPSQATCTARSCHHGIGPPRPRPARGGAEPRHVLHGCDKALKSARRELSCGFLGFRQADVVRDGLRRPPGGAGGYLSSVSGVRATKTDEGSWSWRVPTSRRRPGAGEGPQDTPKLIADASI